MKECNCSDWGLNIDSLNAPFSLGLAAVGHYTGKEFEYCPWCGQALIEITYYQGTEPMCTCHAAGQVSTGGCPKHGWENFGGKQ